MSSATDNNAAPEVYVHLTPAGCYHAIQSSELSPVRQTLHRILGNTSTPALSVYQEQEEREEIAKLCKAGFLELKHDQRSLPEGNLSSLLPTVLPALSERKKALLTESKQGLFIDFAGVSKSQAEELAVLAAGLRATADKSSGLLAGELSIHSRAFAIVDPAGNSELGFWPLHIGDNVFTLIVAGIPRFNSEPFCTLVWALAERYGSHNQLT